jgi:hypothetical protein
MPPESQLAPVSPKNNSSVFIWILIVIAGLLGSYQIYVAYLSNDRFQEPKDKIYSGIPQDSETADWKTYRNEEYGFEVKYSPSDVKNIEENGPNSYELQLKEGKLISGTQAPFLDSIYFKNKFDETILTIDIPDNDSLRVVTGDYEWWLRPCGQEGFAEIMSKENTIFAGQRTLHVVSIFETNNLSKEQTYFYCINYPKNPIIIHYPKTTFGYVVNQILSTFKFIE